MKFHNVSRSGTTIQQHRMHSPSVTSIMREVLHTLGNIDFQHEVELEKLEASASNREVKQYVRDRLLERHRERREPYVELLIELRKQQQRVALAA